jgi:O-methyltransferase
MNANKPIIKSIRSFVNTTTGFDIRHVKRNGKIVWTNPPSTKKHQVISPHATYAPWLEDDQFLRLFEKVKHNTWLDIYKAYEVWSLAKQSIRVEGDILEVGVWRGGSGALIAEAVKNTSKTVYLADTFSGVANAGANDPKYKGGEHSDTSMELVADLLKSISLSNAILLKGIFPDDTQHNVKNSIAFMHCDVDVYLSTKQIVEWTIPRLASGAAILIDDYGWSGCEGVTTYCDEELRQNKNFCFVYNLNGHAVFVKVT